MSDGAPAHIVMIFSGLVLGATLAWAKILKDISPAPAGAAPAAVEDAGRCGRFRIEILVFYAAAAVLLAVLFANPFGFEWLALAMGMAAGVGVTAGAYSATRRGRLGERTLTSARRFTRMMSSASALAAVAASIVLLAASALAASELTQEDAAPKEPRRVTMPLLVGTTLPEARRQLVRLGLELDDVGYEAGAQAPPGVVVEQFPGAGTSLIPGCRVRLVVSVDTDDSIPTTSPPVVATPSPASPSPTPQILR